MAGFYHGFGMFLLGLEALWSIAWLVIMMLFQANTTSVQSNFELRIDLFFTALHLIVIGGVIYHILSTSRPDRWHLIVILFAITIDVTSLLECLLHANRPPVVVPGFTLDAFATAYTLLEAVCIVSLILSALTFMWCAAWMAHFSYIMKKHHHHHHHHSHESTDPFEQPLTKAHHYLKL